MKLPANSILFLVVGGMHQFRFSGVWTFVASSHFGQFYQCCQCYVSPTKLIRTAHTHKLHTSPDTSRNLARIGKSLHRHHQGLPDGSPAGVLGVLRCRGASGGQAGARSCGARVLFPQGHKRRMLFLEIGLLCYCSFLF